MKKWQYLKKTNGCVGRKLFGGNFGRGQVGGIMPFGYYEGGGHTDNSDGERPAEHIGAEDNGEHGAE
jgi:hypothetical protein